MKTSFFAPLASLMIIAACCGQTAMSQNLNAKDQREFFDRNYPFLQPGQEPPGRLAPNDKLKGMMTWQGQMGWRTRHGEAIVFWSLGKPIKVENALYPNGSRGEADHKLDHGFRRRATGERLWLYGRIEIQPDNVIFVDGDQPVYQPPLRGEVPNLEADLARDPAFLAAIKDDRFALAVVRVFGNRTLYKGQDRRAWSCGLRQAAALVANLRGKGESYLDYFMGDAALTGTYPDDRPDIERRLQSRIDEISKSIAKGPPLGMRPEDLFAWLGPGKHSPEDVRRAMDLMQPELEKRREAESETYRKQLQAVLEKAQRDLAVSRERRADDDVFDALYGHLSRLGWRTETEQDRERVRQEWLERAVQVLHEVKELEQRPATSPGAWVEPLRKRSGAAVRVIKPGTLENVPADVRAVETGELERRLTDLALTGRVTEQEHRALVTRLRSR
jgi:hypothetical protein